MSLWIWKSPLLVPHKRYKVFQFACLHPLDIHYIDILIWPGANIQHISNFFSILSLYNLQIFSHNLLIQFNLANITLNSLRFISVYDKLFRVLFCPLPSPSKHRSAITSISWSTSILQGLYLDPLKYYHQIYCNFNYGQNIFKISFSGWLTDSSFVPSN